MMTYGFKRWNARVARTCSVELRSTTKARKMMNTLKNESTIYVCGPMTGKHCYNFERFFYWATVLKDRGYRVINPAELDCLRMFNGWRHSLDNYEETLEMDMRLIDKDADALFVLEGWRDSDGANREIAKASELGLPVYYEDDMR